MTITEKLRKAQERVAGQRMSPGKVLLSRADLNALGISYSRPHLHRLVAEGRFPAPVALGPEPYARKAWRAADVEVWLAALPYTNAEDGGAA